MVAQEAGRPRSCVRLTVSARKGSEKEMIKKK
jgi:hypothetical protein